MFHNKTHRSRFAIAALLLLAAQAAPAAEPAILIMGDSLSSGYRLPDDAGWVALFEQRLRQKGYPHKVVNASVAGETTRNALRRLPDALVRHEPAIVLIQLGARDAISDVPLAQIERNLTLMVQLAEVRGARVALFEMLVPPERKPMPYPRELRDTYRKVARTERVPLVPFFLKSIVGNPAAFLDDGLHPTAAVQPQLLDAVWPFVRPMLKPARATQAGGGMRATLPARPDGGSKRPARQ